MLEAHFEGTLSPEETGSLQAELRVYPDLEAEFELWGDLATLGIEEPGLGLSLRLAEALDAVKREERELASGKSLTWIERMLARFWPSQPAYSFAAATVFLVLGLAAGWLGAGGFEREDPVLRELRAEVRDTRELAILTLLQQESATDRLRAVSYSSQMAAPNSTVVGALIRTLHYDTSVDVRLAAIGALSRYRNQTEVRRAFVEGLEEPGTSPLVQVELIQQLGGIDDPRARQVLEQMAVNPALDPSVRLAAARQVQAAI